MNKNLFKELQYISQKPAPHTIYDVHPFVAATFWNDPYISKQLLKLHLNPQIDFCSRRHDTISKEIKWLTQRFKIGRDTRICDFGCGPGLYTTPWSKAGAQVTGIDISEGSLSYAKQQARQESVEVEYVCEDFLQYSSAKKFDLISMIFCVYNDFDSKQRAHLLKTFYDLLDDDGSVLLDVSTLKKFAEKEEKEVSFASSSYPSFMANFWSPEYHYLFSSCFKYEEEQLTLDKYTAVNAGQIREVFIWIQYYSLQSLKKEFEASGFEIIEHYADFCGNGFQEDAQTLAIIAKKIKSKV